MGEQRQKIGLRKLDFRKFRAMETQVFAINESHETISALCH